MVVPEVLRLEGISKAFAGVRANEGIDLGLREGEVHGLLGENGAGKSTLMNILYGTLRADSGRILVRGQEVTIDSPRAAIGLGIGMVHQHFKLVPDMTVAENVVLGLPGARRGMLDLRAASRRIEELSEAHDLGIHPGDRIESLAVGQQQKVEILKLLYRGAGIFILDEPTAVLTPAEATSLFASLRSFTASGHAIIFITHKLEEVFGHCDRITVLRHGRVVTTSDIGAATKADVARWMVGRDVVLEIADRADVRRGPEVLRVDDVAVRGTHHERFVVDGVSLSVAAGEILGIAGVDGNGQAELADIVTGSLRPDRGSVSVSGATMDPFSPSRFAQLGGAFIPADRRRDGLALDMSVAENLVLRTFARAPFSRRGVIARGEVHEHARDLMSRFDVRASRATAKVRGLSGGNQQKVILAREFSRAPTLVVAAQPTRGLDIGAMEFVYAQLLQLRAAGAGILLISTELSEILTLSDRVAVMYRGRIRGELARSEASPATIGPLMAGLGGDAATASGGARSA